MLDFLEINLDPILKESIILNIYYLLHQMSNIKNRIIIGTAQFYKKYGIIKKKKKKMF